MQAGWRNTSHIHSPGTVEVQRKLKHQQYKKHSVRSVYTDALLYKQYFAVVAGGACFNYFQHRLDILVQWFPAWGPDFSHEISVRGEMIYEESIETAFENRLCGEPANKLDVWS